MTETPYAFPRKLPDVMVQPDEAVRIIEDHAGMTLRDYFAAKVLQGMGANAEFTTHLREWLRSENKSYHEGNRIVAEHAYEIADAMMVARTGKAGA